jgi:hypothetical protein
MKPYHYFSIIYWTPRITGTFAHFYLKQLTIGEHSEVLDLRAFRRGRMSKNHLRTD